MKKAIIRLFVLFVAISWGVAVFLQSQEFKKDQTIRMTNTVIASGGDFTAAKKQLAALKLASKRKKSTAPEQGQIDYKSTLSPMPSKTAGAAYAKTFTVNPYENEYASYKVRKSTEENEVNPTTPNFIFFASAISGKAAGKKLDAYQSGDLAVNQTIGSTKPINIFKTTTDDGEDPFDPGGGTDPGGSYNDAPVGDGFFILLLLLTGYITIKKKLNHTM